MRLGRRTFPEFGRRVSWLLVTKILFSLVVIAYAATISVTSSSYQAEVGSYVSVANNLIATDKGFTLAGSGSSPAGTSCSSPIAFTVTPGTANTQITAGHLVYDVQVNSTMSAPASTKYNVTLVLASTVYGPLCVQTPLVPLNGQTIDCKFDVGTTLPVSPYTFKVTIQ